MTAIAGVTEGRLASSIVLPGSTWPMVRVGAPTDDEGEVMANARLIAAAPDLLVALRSLLMVTTWDDDTDRAVFDAAVGLAQTTIAKAEGRA